MKNFKELTEALSPKTVVVFFGRCNPPTTGHLIAFQTVVNTAKKLKADYSIVISRTQDKKSNPLTLSQKLEYLGILFPSIQFTGASDTMRTPIEVLKQLNLKYKNIIFVAGSDRVDEFSTLFNKYNGTEFHYDSIKVVSAGERDPDSDSASGMSATKMRKAASDNDIGSFKKGLLAHVRDIDAKRLMNDIRGGMGLDVIKEEFKCHTSDLREKYIAGEIFNEGSFVISNTTIYKIINRNSNYLTVSNCEGTLSKKWLTDVETIDETIEITDIFKGISEMKFSSSDKLKVAKIIGGMLGADVEKMTNPEQIVNAGLKIAKTKPMNAESSAILQRMLKTASDAGITYDTKLIAVKTDEAEVGDIDSADFKLSASGRKVRARNLVFDTKTNSKNANVADEATEQLKTYRVTNDHHNISTNVKASSTTDARAKATESNKKFAHRDTEANLSWTNEATIATATKGIDKGDNEVTALDIEMPHTHKNDEIKTRVERAHVTGQRHKEVEPKNQVIADRHHATLNNLGGKQVLLPTGYSLGGSSDHVVKMKVKHYSECVEDTLESDKDDTAVSDEDIEDMIKDIKDVDDIIDLYDASELAFIDDETGEYIGAVPTTDENPVHESTELNEVLSRAERIKSAIRFHRSFNKRERSIKIALTKKSSQSTINHRARSLAIRVMKTKLAKKPLNQMSVSEKDRVDRIIEKRKTVLDRMAVKLVPRIRGIESARLEHSKFTK